MIRWPIDVEKAIVSVKEQGWPSFARASNTSDRVEYEGYARPPKDKPGSPDAPARQPAIRSSCDVLIA